MGAYSALPFPDPDGKHSGFTQLPLKEVFSLFQLKLSRLAVQCTVPLGDTYHRDSMQQPYSTKAARQTCRAVSHEIHLTSRRCLDLVVDETNKCDPSFQATSQATKCSERLRNDCEETNTRATLGVGIGSRDLGQSAR